MQKDMDALVIEHVIPGTQKAIKKVAEDRSIKIAETDSTEISTTNENKILVPGSMNKLQAAWNLVREYREEETYKDFDRAYPLRFANDFLSTVNKLIKVEFGAIIQSHRDTYGKPSNNQELVLNLKYDGDKKITEPAYVGSVIAPVWEDAIIDIFPGHLRIQAKTKYSVQISKFFNRIEDQLKIASIVKGNAVELRVDANGYVWTEPVKVKINDGIFLEDSVDRIVNNLIIPSMGETKKKSILLTGDFGTGKTETAIKMGVKGMTDYGRTFFYLKNADQFSLMLAYIPNYPHSTVFIEDIDQMVDGERTTQMNDILNSIDGAALKYSDVTFIFTTNAHDKINPAMRRPGRIDEVVHFDYATPRVIEQIYRYHLDGMPGSDTINFSEAAAYTGTGLQGAIVTEIAQRAKKYATNLHMGVISTDVLKDAIASMQQHIKFMKAPQQLSTSTEDALAMIGDHVNRNIM